MADLDNRINFPPTEIDFSAVGTTGQDHDTFPKPGQARYDWMRLFLIGLLAQQSSTTPPTQYRIGTPWFNKETQSIQIWNGSAWVSLATVISLGDLTLQAFHDEIIDKINNVNLKYTFSGYAVQRSTEIPLPTSIVAKIGSTIGSFRPLVYVDGKLLDPRLTSFSITSPYPILLDVSVRIEAGSKFTVIVDSFDVFSNETVVAQ